jgi:hypothetical protein
MPAPVNVDNASALLPQYYSRPGQLRQEYAVDSVLELSTVPAEIIAQQRPQIPQQHNPPRYGYRGDPLTIVDVLSTDRWAPTRRSWVSGAPGLGNPRVEEVPGATGSQRNSLTGPGNPV